jgi:hypothetical protein
LLPVLYDETMYLFDLSPHKSLFRRVYPDSVPTYEDYLLELQEHRIQRQLQQSQ